MARGGSPYEFGGAVGPDDGEKHLRILLDALAEYAGKLRAASEKAYQTRWRRAVALYSATTVAALGAALTISLVSHLKIELEYRLGVYTILVMCVAGLVLLTTSGRDRDRLRNEEVAILTEQVARLIHLAAQFEEHGKIPFSEKMLLDLRLAEAEAAVRMSHREQIAKGSYRRESFK
jgi:hypothetical protein